MAKKLLAIYGSYRPNSNSSIAVDELVKKADPAEWEVEKVYLKEKNIRPCMGCFACRSNGGVCIQKDDMPELLAKMEAADKIIISSPVFMFGEAGVVKVFRDRLYPLLEGVNGQYASRIKNPIPTILVYSQGAPVPQAFESFMQVSEASYGMLGFPVAERIVVTLANEGGTAGDNKELMDRIAGIEL